jgi:hypothetical protein
VRTTLGGLAAAGATAAPVKKAKTAKAAANERVRTKSTSPRSI